MANQSTSSSQILILTAYNVSFSFRSRQKGKKIPTKDNDQPDFILMIF